MIGEDIGSGLLEFLSLDIFIPFPFTAAGKKKLLVFKNYFTATVVLKCYDFTMYVLCAINCLGHQGWLPGERWYINLLTRTYLRITVQMFPLSPKTSYCIGEKIPDHKLT